MYQLINTKVIVLIFRIPTDCQNTTMTMFARLGKTQHEQHLLLPEKEWAVSDHVSAFIELTKDQEESSNQNISE